MAFLVAYSPITCLFHNSVCNRVRIVLLKTGGYAQNRGLVPSAEGNNACNARRSLCKRARFIENYCIRFGNGFNKFTALKRNVKAAALFHSRKHRNRHRKL